MRYLFTICCVIFFSGMYSQTISYDFIEMPLQSGAVCGKIRARNSLAKDDYKALIVINGLPSDYDEANKLFPEDVESITILKKENQQGFFSCSAPSRDVILITTKSANRRKFIIKDFLNGERVVGATITFISTDSMDTLMFVADDSAMVVTDKLKWNKEYKIIVSSAGYTTLKTSMGKSRNQDLFLERDLQENSEVVVSAICRLNKRVIKWSCGSVVKTCVYTVQDKPLPNEKNNSISRIYPNPAQKGKTVTVSTQMQTGSEIDIKVFSLSGQLIVSQKKKLVKGNNQLAIDIESHWAPGTYFVQILNPQGQLLKSEKLIIQ